MNKFLGSLNILSFSDLPDGRSNPELESNDPLHVKREIGLFEVNENLFATINSGVRFWPFVIVARDLDDTDSKQRIVGHLRRIRKKQPPQKQNVGPASMATFYFYRRMYRRLQERSDPDSKPLRDFVNDRRRSYDGDFNIFQCSHNTDKWKRALVKSMGVPGRELAKLLNRLKDKDDTEDIVEEAVSHILKNMSKYDPWLWKGAFCYAFLRCMYGINEIQGDEFRVVSHYKATDWADILVQVLNSPKSAAPDRLKRYVSLIRKSKDSPPWKKITKSLKEQNRIVLSNLRFHAFYNLYVRPIPKGY